MERRPPPADHRRWWLEPRACGSHTTHPPLPIPIPTPESQRKTEKAKPTSGMPLLIVPRAMGMAPRNMMEGGDDQGSTRVMASTNLGVGGGVGVGWMGGSRCVCSSSRVGRQRLRSLSLRWPLPGEGWRPARGNGPNPVRGGAPHEEMAPIPTRLVAAVSGQQRRGTTLLAVKAGRPACRPDGRKGPCPPPAHTRPAPQPPTPAGWCHAL